MPQRPNDIFSTSAYSTILRWVDGDSLMSRWVPLSYRAVVRRAELIASLLLTLLITCIALGGLLPIF